MEKRFAQLTLRASLAAAFLCFVAIAPSSATAQVGGGGVVYGSGHVFAVKSPDGWVIDNQVARAMEIPAAFYPSGASWRNTPVRMYVNTAEKEEGETLESFIKSDIAKFKECFTGIEVREGVPLKTSDGVSVPVNEYRGDKWGNFELVGYLEEQKAFVVFVLTTPSLMEFERSQNAFQQLVNSYQNKGDTDPFEVANAIAGTLVDTPEGSEYTGVVVKQLFGDRERARYCFGKAQGGDKREFTLLAEIQSDGTVSNVLVRPETEVAKCFQGILWSSKFPTPPQSNFWWRLELRIDDTRSLQMNLTSLTPAVTTGPASRLCHEAPASTSTGLSAIASSNFPEQVGADPK